MQGGCCLLAYMLLSCFLSSFENSAQLLHHAICICITPLFQSDMITYHCFNTQHNAHAQNLSADFCCSAQQCSTVLNSAQQCSTVLNILCCSWKQSQASCLAHAGRGGGPDGKLRPLAGCTARSSACCRGQPCRPSHRRPPVQGDGDAGRARIPSQHCWV